MSIIGHRKHASYTEKQEAAQNTKLFIQSFPIIFGFTIITTISFFIILLTGFSNFNYQLTQIGLKHIIPIFLMLLVMIPITINNYSNASLELKKRKPLLLITVLLMVFADSVTLTFLIFSFFKI